VIRAAIVAVALVAAVWGLLHVAWYDHGQIVDYGVYQHYGYSVVHDHAVPYRDFALEYPPGALPVFIVPSFAAVSQYQHVFQLLMAICLVAAVLAVFSIAGPRAALATALAPLALGSVILSRFDLWPAALAVLGLAAVLRGRRLASALLVGTAVAAKFWPILLVPLVAVWIARSAGGRAAGRWLGVTAATVAAWFLPFLVLSPHGVAHAFHEQFARPLQLESLGAAVLIAIHHLAGTTLHMQGSFGSLNVTGPGTHAAAIAATGITVLVLAALYVAYGRSDADEDDLLRFSAAVVAVTIAFGKVFSPQFLIWLLPLVPLVRGLRGAVATGLLYVSLVLTQIWFPHRYWDLAYHFAAAPSVELLLRDLTVVGLAAVLVWPRLQHQVLGEHRSRVEALERVRAQVQ
jgi:uncharacterized membrane protein